MKSHPPKRLPAPTRAPPLPVQLPPHQDSTNQSSRHVHLPVPLGQTKLKIRNQKLLAVWTSFQKPKSHKFFCFLQGLDQNSSLELYIAPGSWEVSYTDDSSQWSSSSHERIPPKRCAGRSPAWVECPPLPPHRLLHKSILGDSSCSPHVQRRQSKSQTSHSPSPRHRCWNPICHPKLLARWKSHSDDSGKSIPPTSDLDQIASAKVNISSAA